MENDVLVLTPEKTIVSFQLAGLGARAAAHLLDVVGLIVLLIAFSLSFGLMSARIAPEIGTGIILFVIFATPLVYFIGLEGLWNGQTVGKKALNIRVRMADGTPITFAAALGRNLLRPADMLPGPYFVGLLAVFTNPRAQRLGDLVADTVVCYELRPEPRFELAPHIVGIHPLEGHVGDLRGMTIEEYNVLRRYADRFPELAPPVQEKLTREVWEPIAGRRAIPSYPNIHPIYLAEAVVMKYGREHGVM